MDNNPDKIEERIRYAVLIGLIMYCLFLASKTFASNFPNQTGFTTLYTWSNANYPIIQNLGNGWNGLINTLAIRTDTTADTTNCGAALFAFSDPSYSSQVQWFGFLHKASSSINATTSEIIFSSSSPEYALNAGYYYQMKYSCNGGFTDNLKGIDTQTYGELQVNGSNTGGTLYMSYNGETTNTTGTLTISLAYPSSSITNPIRILNNWVIKLENISTSTGQIYVQYGQNSSTLQYAYRNGCNIINGVSTCNTGTPDIYAIANTTNLINASVGTDEWYAQPYFFNSDTFEFTYGNIVSFHINNTGTAPPNNELDPSIYAIASGSSDDPNNIGYFAGNTTSTSWCTPPSGSGWLGLNFMNWEHLSYGLCRVAETLFKPYGSIDTYISPIIDDVKTVFPFKLITQAEEQATSSQASSTDYTTLSIPLPMSSTTVTLLSSSTITNTFGTNVKNVYFQVMRDALYLSTFAIIIWAII